MKIDKGEIASRIYRGNNGVLSKFEPQYYEDAVILRRWETPVERNLKPECTETPMRYRGGEYISFTLNIPKPLRPVNTGTIIIIRTSKNRYRAAFDNGKNAMIETFEAIKEIELFAEKFFT